jgi:HK97 family phage major capsid protein
MTPESLKEVQDAIALKQAALEKMVSEKATIESLKAMQDDIDKFKSMEEMVVKQGEALELMRKNNEQSRTSIPDQLSQSLSKKSEEIKGLKGKKGSSVEFTLDTKAAAMTTANITDRQMLGSTLIAGATDIARRRPFMMDLVSVRGNSSGKINWIDKRNPDGTTGGTAEGVLKNQIDFDLVEVSTTLKKRTNFIKVSEEMLEDIDFIQSEIQNELLVLLALDLDAQILNGNGIGTNLNGINNDVVKVAATQVISANFMPNYLLINPIDKASMELSKTIDGEYTTPSFVTADGSQIAGLRVIENNGIAAGEYLVMDSTKCATYLKNGIRIEMGRDSDDFSKNMWTIIAEVRAENVISENNYEAFVKGDFATDKAAITV